MSDLKPLQKELLALEKKLSQEQQDWIVKRNSLSREVQRLKALIPLLEAKELSLNDRIANQTEVFDKLNDDIDNFAIAVANLDQHLAKRTKECEELDKRTEAKITELTRIRTEVDGKLVTYKEERKLAIEDELQAIKDELHLAQTQLAEDTLTIQSNQQVIADLSKSIAEIREDNHTILKNENAEIDKVRKELETLQAERDDAETELGKLYREKAQVSSDTRKAAERHKNFIEYEQKARKELETKNTALNKKQEELGQEERFIKARRSILPEM